MSEHVCRWHLDDENTYVTDCGQYFVTIDGTTCEWAKHCCFCGRRIEFEEGDDA